MARFTMLSAMADKDFVTALDRHVEWGLSDLDLKGSVFGKGVVDLSDEEADRAAELIDARSLSTFCMSTTLFDENVEVGEAVFRETHLGAIDRVVEVAHRLKPDLVRLLAAKSTQRDCVSDSIVYLADQFPWLIPCYREAIEKLAAAGFRVTVENECHDCIFSTPSEILSFFDALDCGDAVNLTWDVQNLWQMGTFPSIEVYQELRPLIAYYHLKGGMSDEQDHSSLRWRSSLEDASWPVEEITEQVEADGVSPVICLNSSHGERKNGYDYSNVVERDLDFVMRRFGEKR